MPYQFMSISYQRRPWRAETVGVVIVVPAFSEGDQRYQQVIGGEVFGRKPARAPEVGDGVDHPGRVETDYDAREYSPEAGGPLLRPRLQCRSF
jgi:hypothetical protein